MADNPAIQCSGVSESAEIAELISRANTTVAKRFGLNQQNCAKHPSFCQQDWVEKDLERGVRYFSWVQYGKILGCYAYEHGEAGVVFLNRLAVLPGEQRRGIGGSLVLHCLQHAKQDGCKHVSVGIIAKHHELVRWYKKLGFYRKEVTTYSHLPFEVMLMCRNSDSI